MEVNSDEFLMVGNSLKSDILPVLSIGGHAVYVPYHITWQHEIVEDTGSAEFREISRLPELLDIVRIENNYLCSESFAV